MAGPLLRAVGSPNDSAAATTITPVLPTSPPFSRGIYLALCISRNTATHSSSAGWTVIQQFSGTGLTASLWYANVSALAPVFTWTGTAACSAQVLEYLDPMNVTDAAPGVSSVSNGSGNPHNSASITTTRANSLAVLVNACAVSALAMNPPPGWTESSSFSSISSGTSIDWFSRGVPATATATGATSETGGAAAYAMFQVELRMTAPGAGLAIDSIELAPWQEPDSGGSVAKIEASGWLQPDDGSSVAGIEIIAWLEPGDQQGIRRRVMVNGP